MILKSLKYNYNKLRSITRLTIPTSAQKRTIFVLRGAFTCEQISPSPNTYRRSPSFEGEMKIIEIKRSALIDAWNEYIEDGMGRKHTKR